MVHLGMDGKLSTREIEWRWNHGDPTARSLENTSGSYRGLPPNAPHRSRTARHPGLPLQESLF